SAKTLGVENGGVHAVGADVAMIQQEVEPFGAHVVRQLMSGQNARDDAVLPDTQRHHQLIGASAGNRVAKIGFECCHRPFFNTEMPRYLGKNGRLSYAVLWCTG